MIEISDLNKENKKSNHLNIGTERVFNFKTQTYYFRSLENEETDIINIKNIFEVFLKFIYMFCFIGYILSYINPLLKIYKNEKLNVINNKIMAYVLRDISLGLIGFVLLKLTLRKILKN